MTWDICSAQLRASEIKNGPDAFHRDRYASACRTEGPSVHPSHGQFIHFIVRAGDASRHRGSTIPAGASFGHPRQLATAATLHECNVAECSASRYFGDGWGVHLRPAGRQNRNPRDSRMKTRIASLAMLATSVTA